MQVKRGTLIVMTGASGVGKGTIRDKLKENEPFFYSVSWTTREPRAGEQHKVDYYFKTSEQFEHERDFGGGFLEWAEFVGHFYGTPKAPVLAALERGENVLLEIEVQGALQVKACLPEAILVFIMPPSLTELRRRLEGRATETPERIEKRIRRAKDEILQAHQFEYCVINDSLERAVAEFKAILYAERLRTERWTMAELENIVNT